MSLSQDDTGDNAPKGAKFLSWRRLGLSGKLLLLTIPLAICKYIGLLFWPVNLSIFHSTPMVTSPLSLRFILPVLGIVALAFGLWQLRGSRLARHRFGGRASGDGGRCWSSSRVRACSCCGGGASAWGSF